jgi:hypothetical protein
LVALIESLERFKQTKPTKGAISKDGSGLLGQADGVGAQRVGDGAFQSRTGGVQRAVDHERSLHLASAPGGVTDAAAAHLPLLAGDLVVQRLLIVRYRRIGHVASSFDHYDG